MTTKKIEAKLVENDTPLASHMDIVYYCFRIVAESNKMLTRLEAAEKELSILREQMNEQP